MDEFKSKIKSEGDELKKEFIEKTAAWIMAGFGLVAALAWNEAIKSLFDVILGPSKASLFAKFSYAVIVTLIAVFISRRLAKLTEEKE